MAVNVRQGRSVRHAVPNLPSALGTLVTSSRKPAMIVSCISNPL